MLDIVEVDSGTSFTGKLLDWLVVRCMPPLIRGGGGRRVWARSQHFGIVSLEG